MAGRQRARTVSTAQDGSLRKEWFTVETSEGVAVGGLDSLFDFESEEKALTVVTNLVVDAGKPLTVVKYTRVELDTYAAVTKIEKV